MKAVALIALCLVAVAAAFPQFTVELNEEWDAYKSTHGKAYEADEELMRRLIWEQNLQHIQKHNLEFDRGVHTYTLGMNQFGDMTFTEFKAKYLSKMPPSQSEGTTFLPSSNVGDLPTEVDWRPKGYVTGIKDQKQCGSCWAFSTTGSLEGQHFKKTGTLVSLSEQNLVDCSGKFGNMGCNGGLMDNAFNYIKANKGVDTEECYPYKARDEKCTYKTSCIGATVTGFVDIPSKNESALQQAVATIGPISVAIDAGHNSFQLYKSGVYSEPRCSQTELDHGVLAVGYGTDNGKDYWLVKNSWGTSWGMKGYIMMSRNKKNQCGIATAASYPLV
jgi:cathepsin L